MNIIKDVIQICFYLKMHLGESLLFLHVLNLPHQFKFWSLLHFNNGNVHLTAVSWKSFIYWNVVLHTLCKQNNHKIDLSLLPLRCTEPTQFPFIWCLRNTLLGQQIGRKVSQSADLNANANLAWLNDPNCGFLSAYF